MLLRNVSPRVVILKDATLTEYRVPAFGEIEVGSDIWTDSTFRSWVRYRERDLVIIDNVESLSPWVIDISAFPTPSYENNWETVTVSSTRFYNGSRSSDGSNGAEIAWDIALASGTWTVELCHHTSSDRGIYHILFDGNLRGTIDGYSSSLTQNVWSKVADLTVTRAQKYRISLKMNTRNVSNVTAWTGDISHLRLLRTQ